MADVFTCPVCASDVDIGSVLVEYGVKGIVPSSQGVRCRSCRTVLDIVQHKVFLALFLTIGAMVLLLHLLSKIGVDDEVATIPIIALVVILTFKSFKWFTELRVPSPDKEVNSDDEIWFDPNEIDVEFQQHMARELNLAGHELETGDRALIADWRCADCDEENTKEFHSCWKCGNSHDSTKV